MDSMLLRYFSPNREFQPPRGVEIFDPMYPPNRFGANPEPECDFFDLPAAHCWDQILENYLGKRLYSPQISCILGERQYL